MRRAQTQILFREVNERIRERGAPEGRLELLCECFDRDCTELVLVSNEDYEDIRRVPTHFLVARSHADPTIERIIERRDAYAVVEKFGIGGIRAVECDPRRRPTKTDTRVA